MSAQTGSSFDSNASPQRAVLLNSSLPVLGMGGLGALGDELAEDAVPNDLKQAMKKMSKKDSTTKLKVCSPVKLTL